MPHSPQGAASAPQPKGALGERARVCGSAGVVPETVVCWVLCSSARLCPEALGTFVLSCVLPTASGCNQAVFVCLRNNGEAECSCGC